MGKSLAVGVGTRGTSDEMDVDLVNEGMLQLHDSVGDEREYWYLVDLRGVTASARMTDAMQG